MGDISKLTYPELSELTAKFKLGHLESFDTMTHGISNSNYKVTLSGNDYLFKISNAKNENELLDEMVILDYLKSNNFPYSIFPLNASKKGPVLKVGKGENSIVCLLFPFITSSVPESPDHQSLSEIGKALATLHSVPVTEDKIRNHNEVGYGRTEIKQYLLSGKAQHIFIDTVNDLFHGDAQVYLRNISLLDLPSGIIHGDMYIDNALFSEENEIITLLDFEQSGYGSFLFDLGISISGCCLEKGTIKHDFIESYLQGYESIRPLYDIEKTFLNDFIVLGLVSISLWRIKRFTEGNLDETRKESYIELLERAKEFKKNV